MLIRRCAFVVLEPKERSLLDITSLMVGGNGLLRSIHWVALAAHLDDPIDVDIEQREALGKISSHEWKEVAEVGTSMDVLLALVGCGLLISEEDNDFRKRDDAVRSAHWWGLSALAHRHGRWSGLDSVSMMESAGMTDVAGLRRRLGPPPPAVKECSQVEEIMPLPRIEADVLERAWAERCTCRNFDALRLMDLETFSKMLQRVLMAQGVVERDGLTFIKKNVASGGGLHAIDAYVVVQGVDGVKPGIYHYHPVKHALESMEGGDEPLAALMRKWLSGQYWFADAHVQIVLTARFERSFWKYREHSKAYRALVLEVGHISQAIYLSALDLKLGAFVTAAINECDIERVLGLESLREGVIAVCGFGLRSDRMQTTEFDPNGRIWRAD